MKHILLIMHRKVLGDSLLQYLHGDPELELSAEYNYKMALMTAEISGPDVALVEIPESGEWTPKRCLDLCGMIRAQVPECKLMILCPEENREACSATIHAAQSGDIDDFVYYDTTTRYLISKLAAL